MAVLDSMASAVELVQKRLGGEIVLGSGGPFNKEAERKKVEVVVEKLKHAGFVPGESATCRVF